MYDKRIDTRRAGLALACLAALIFAALTQQATALFSGNPRGAYVPVSALALQPDGKIVAVGSTHGDLAVIRYRPDGRLDRSFGGGDGVVTADIAQRDSANSVALQPNGKIVVAGSTLEPRPGVGAGPDSQDFALARFNANGTLDRSFGDNGHVAADITTVGSADAATAVAIQPDGKIVAAGWGDVDSFEAGIVLVGLDRDGSFDEAFAASSIYGVETAGVVTTVISPEGGGDDYANAMVIRADGKIVLAGAAGAEDGTSAFALASHFALVRYDTSGRLDPAFGGDGIVTTPVLAPENRSLVFGLALAGGGRVLAAGTTRGQTTGMELALARYNPGGGLDSGFGGGNGISVPGVPEGSASGGLALGADRIFVVGGTRGSSSDFLYSRYETGGALDQAGGRSAVIATDTVAGASDHATAAALQPDGKLVAAGVAGRAPVTMALARYNPNGSMDAGFGSAGIVSTAICSAEPATIVGSERSERLAGTAAADVIAAGGGSDSVSAGRGKDLVCGGDGKDRLFGAAGDDRLLGEGGADLIRGDAGRDLLLGGPGNDRLFGGPAADRLRGGPGKDRLRGGPGRDSEKQ